MSARTVTPEARSMQAIANYLKVCALGSLKRRNVGQFRLGDAPKHPWAPDTRRVVRVGERGESDYELQLARDTRSVFIEVKAEGWKPPIHPKPGASRSTWKVWTHYQEQLAFQTRQRDRGHFAFFARSPWEVYEQLASLGFKNLPVPSHSSPQIAPKNPSVSTQAKKPATILGHPEGVKP